MQREIIHITRILTLIALLMGWSFLSSACFPARDALMASIFALSLIVANVPEGLLPTITLSLSLASQRMARRNALIKNLDSVETLGSATVICTDKTGTLTRNEMTLKELWLAGGEDGRHLAARGTGSRANSPLTSRMKAPRTAWTSPAQRRPPQLPGGDRRRTACAATHRAGPGGRPPPNGD